MSPRPRPPRRPLARRWLAAALAPAAAGVLVVFHAALFWERLASQSLIEPAVAARWAASAALLGLLGYLRRAGVPVLWGRRALVFWLLVLLLHIGLPAAPSGLPGGDGLPLLLALPAAGGAAGLLALALALAAARRRRAVVRLARRRPHPGWLPSLAGHSRALFCRPPPALAA